jgi:hypothetical protein
MSNTREVYLVECNRERMWLCIGDFFHTYAFFATAACAAAFTLARNTNHVDQTVK